MIDFHCHLDLYSNAERLVEQVSKKNHFTLVVTTSPRAWQATSKVFSGYNNIKIALGMHPEIVKKKSLEQRLLISLVPKVEFIGEIGLDGSIQHRNTIELQESIFKSVLEQCEIFGGKILSVHSRNAASRVLDNIEHICKTSIPVLHWFSGTIEETQRAVAMGCWFSVGPAMLQGLKGRNILKELPSNRILPETDGPFTYNGTKPFMPWEAITIEEIVSHTWKLTKDEVRKQFNQNLKILLNSLK